VTEIALSVLGQELRLDCRPEEERRLRDLVAQLQARLGQFCDDSEGLRCLAITALSLLDEVQASHAALARARAEIERLSDMIVDARADSLDAALGRVGTLRVLEGSA
jgi:cell division protein ZapA (FtsZ GTPase activity inhibitor)